MDATVGDEKLVLVEVHLAVVHSLQQKIVGELEQHVRGQLLFRRDAIIGVIAGLDDTITAESETETITDELDLCHTQSGRTGAPSIDVDVLRVSLEFHKNRHETRERLVLLGIETDQFFQTDSTPIAHTIRFGRLRNQKAYKPIASVPFADALLNPRVLEKPMRELPRHGQTSRIRRARIGDHENRLLEKRTRLLELFRVEQRTTQQDSTLRVVPVREPLHDRGRKEFRNHVNGQHVETEGLVTCDTLHLTADHGCLTADRVKNLTELEAGIGELPSGRAHSVGRPTDLEVQIRKRASVRRIRADRTRQPVASVAVDEEIAVERVDGINHPVLVLPVQQRVRAGLAFPL